LAEVSYIKQLLKFAIAWFRTKAHARTDALYQR